MAPWTEKLTRELAISNSGEPSVDRLKPYIEVQKQIVEKQVEEKMNNNETLSDSE